MMCILVLQQITSDVCHGQESFCYMLGVDDELG